MVKISIMLYFIVILISCNNYDLFFVMMVGNEGMDYFSWNDSIIGCRGNLYGF